MVKCADCGFLGLRLRGQWGFVDADRNYRANQQSLYGTLVSANPYCFMGRADLVDEMLRTSIDIQVKEDESMAGGNPPGMLGRDSFREVLDAERPDCVEDAFTPMQPGLTPKEHREMLDRQWMREQEQKVREVIWAREDARDEAMRRREDVRDEAMRRREDVRDEAARGRHRDQIWWLGVALIMATIFGSIIQAGWIPSPRGTSNQTVTVVVATSQSVPSTASPQPTTAP